MTTTDDEQLPYEVRSGFRWPLLLGVLAFLAMILFWIWVFANRGSIAHNDEFQDPVFLTAAEQVCANRQAMIADLPNPTTASGPEERAVLVDQGTALLELMVAELAALPLPTDPKGAETVPQWLADYDIYLQDRNDWSALLASGQDPIFTLSAGANGARVTDGLTTFADVNEMRSCAPSGDA